MTTVAKDKAEEIDWEEEEAIFLDPENYALPKRGAVSRGTFEINGIRFPVPPQGISITEQNQNFNFETLRNRESTKIRSGHGRIDITVTAFFTGNTTGSVELVEGVPVTADPLDAINGTLMPILYSLKKMPLCFLDNELLRTTLPISPGEVIGAFIRSVNVGTVPGMPYMLSAEFQFVWFNHRPFTPRLQFRREWHDAGGAVDHFTNSYNSVVSQNSTSSGGQDDSGRFLFIKNYGHPSNVFNATAINTWTEDIREARPLLEWLWPYRYESTNPAIRQEDSPNGGNDRERPYTERALRSMPPFRLESFDDNVIFGFMIPQVPGVIDTPEGTKSLTDIISKFTTSQKLIPEPAAPTPAPAPAPIVSGKSAPPDTDVISTYRVPGQGLITPQQKAEANFVYTILTDEGYTPAFAIAAIVQASHESTLNPKISHRRGVAHGYFQLNTYTNRKTGSKGLGASDPSFEEGRTAGSEEQWKANSEKYYNAHDLQVNVRRFISHINVNKRIRTIAKDPNKSPAECFEAIFWSSLGVGGRSEGKNVNAEQLAEREKLYAGRVAASTSRVPGWNDPAFNSGSRAALPGRISASDLDLVTGDIPLEQRFSEMFDPEEALRLAMEAHLPESTVMPTTAELLELSRDLAGKTSDKQFASELLALGNAVSQNAVIVKHAITGKIAQLSYYELDISQFMSAVVPMSLAVTFGTNFVMMPLDGHRFATTQYVGGQQTAGTISFRALTPIGRQFVREFQSLVNAYETSVIHFREFAKRRGIEVINPLLNSMNIQSMLLETMNIDTITGSPDDLNIVMRFVDNTITEESLRPLLAIEEVGFDTVGTNVLDLMIKKGYVGIKHTVGEGDSKDATSHMVTEEYDDGLIVTAPGFKNRGRAPVNRALDNALGFEDHNGNLLEGLKMRRSRSANVDNNLPLKRRQQLPDGRYKFFYDDGRITIISNDERDPLNFPERSTNIKQRTASEIDQVITIKFEALNYGPDNAAREAVDKLIELSGYRKAFSLTQTESFSYERKDNTEVITPEQYGTEIGRQIPASSSMQRGIFQALYGDRVDKGFVSSDRFVRWSSGPGRRLLSALGRPDSGKMDPDFAALFASSMKGASYQKTNQAYPDLLLPPNPISGLCIDTNPDFFLVNQSDTRLANVDTLKIIHGADIATTGVKAVGFAKGSAAIDYGHENFKDIYGVGTGTGLAAANLGRDNIYVANGDSKGVNNGVFKTTVKAKPVNRIEAPPETGWTLASLPGREAIVQNDIAGRKTNKGYKRDLSMDVHYAESAYKEDLKKGFLSGTADGEQLENLNKIQHVFNPKTYNEMFKTFCDRYKSDHYAIRRAFPTFKVFFVEEDGEADFTTPEGRAGEIINKLASTPSLDDFYGVNAIKEISVVHNKESAVSTCVIQVLDLDGVLYNRKFDAGKGGGPVKDLTGTINSNGSRVPENKLIDDNNPFYSTMIKEGMKVIVKFGYSNDPTELDTIFVGQIAQFQGNQVLTIVCQSYGAELVAKTFGTDPTKNVDLWSTTTADLVHDTMDREEVRHFGRWRLSDIDVTGELFGHQKIRPDGRTKTVWTWRPSVVDDNIFVPPEGQDTTWWETLTGDLHYVFWNTTIWDVFKEMELRHPDYIAYPVPYGQGADARMTMFFGQPDMEYLSRPALDKFERDGEFTAGNTSQTDLRRALTRVGTSPPPNFTLPGAGKTYRGAKTYPKAPNEQVAIAVGAEKVLEAANAPGDPKENLRALARSVGAQEDTFVEWHPEGKRMVAEISRLESEARTKAESEQGLAPGSLKKDYSRIDSNKFYRTTVAWQGPRLRPFRNYELVTSLHDILKNNIRTDTSESFNSVELHYTDNILPFSSQNLATFGQTEPTTLVVNADDNIKEHHIRRTIEAWPNCTNTDLARRYASQLLANSLKKTYRGEIVILGKPHLKPYDIVWLNDTYSDMAGPIEIEEVVHTFSQETGFITEIVPSMIVSVAGDAKLLMVDAIGKFFDTTAKDFTNGAMLGLSVGTAFLGGGIALAAGKTVGQAATTAGNLASKAGGAASKASKYFNILSEEGKKQAANLMAKAKASATNPLAPVTGSTRAGVSKGALVTAGGIEVARQTGLDDTNGINDESIAGFATGLGVAAAATIVPITIGVSAIVAGALLYKFLKYNTTREPVLITPLIKDGKPYILGLEGFETDGLLCTNFDGVRKTSGQKWDHYIDGITEANNIVATGWTNFWDGE